MNKKLSTKDKIILKAIELFNLEGSSSVTTNHIAKALGISPGNLYYHFRNKEEIIREIYEKMIIEFADNWKVENLDDYLNLIWDKLANTLLIFYKYRFFMNEIIILLKTDSQLKLRYNEIKRIRLESLKMIFNDMREKTYLKEEITSEELDELLELLWFTGDFWIMKNEMELGERDLDNSDIRRYLKANYMILKFYLTEKANRDFPIERALEKFK